MANDDALTVQHQRLTDAAHHWKDTGSSLAQGLGLLLGVLITTVILVRIAKRTSRHKARVMGVCGVCGKGRILPPPGKVCHECRKQAFDTLRGRA